MPKHAGLATVTLALSSALSIVSCGEHVVVVDLVNLSAETSSVAAYYRIDTDAYHASALQSGQFQISSPVFGIRPPSSRDGTLTVQVFAYKNNLPCALNKGSTEAKLSTAGKINATAVLDVIPFAPCKASDAPVSYPAEAIIWAGTASNVWIVGKDAAVLHWDGTLFHNIVLPDSIAGTPRATWKAVRGDSQGNTWLVGDHDSAVRIDAAGNPTRLALDFGSLNQLPVTWTGVYAESGTAYLSGTTDSDAQGYIGIYSAATGKVTVNQVDKAPINLSGSSYGLYAVDCSSLNDCWYVGERSLVIHYTGGTNYGLVGIKNDATCGSPPSDISLRGVYANGTLSSVKMVGTGNAGGGTGRFIAHNGTCFFANDKDQSSSFTPGSLLAISGRRPDDLIVSGKDAIYRWRASGAALLTGYEKGTWQSASALSGGFFATQASQILYSDLAP